MPRELFVSQEVFELETDAIWNTMWLYVGHESEIPENNDFRVRDVGDRSIIFCRDEGGRIRVFLNTCPHRGAEVCRLKEGNAQRFTCVYHSWSFNNRGDLVATPDPESYPQGFRKDMFGLVPAPRVESYRGFVFLNYDPASGSLVEYLARATDYLDLVADQCEVGMSVLEGTHEYAIRANWKLLVENSVDGYHGMPVHSTYFDFLKQQGDDVSASSRYAGSRALDLGNGHAAITRVTPLARAVARWSPSLGSGLRPVLEARRDGLIRRLGVERASEVANRDYNLLIFPNLIVLNAMGVVLRTIAPSGVSEVRASSWMLAPADQSDEERHAMLEQCLLFFGPAGMATPDDADVLESVQRGLRSWRETKWSDVSRGLDKEEPTSRDENQMQAFWRRYDALMSAGRT